MPSISDTNPRSSESEKLNPMATGVDRISNLPPELAVRILSFLPSTQHRIRTSVLSKKWRHLCSSVPVLDFLPSNPAAVIDRYIQLYPCDAALVRLRIDASRKTIPDIGSFDPWIRFSASRSVNNLALSFDDRPYSYPPYKPNLPPSIFLCSPTLSSLKLRCCNFPQLNANFPGFPSLKTLFLEYVEISNESVEFLISKSPLLETMNLNCCPEISRVEISPIRNPCVENLKLSICRVNESGGRIFVDAPRMRFFDFNGNVKRLEIRDSPRLVKADVSAFRSEFCSSRDHWMRIMSAISRAEVLAVSSWFTQFVFDEDESFEMRGPMFQNLKEIRWNGVVVTGHSRRALMFLFRQCPVLEALYIDLDFYAGMMHEHEQLTNAWTWTWTNAESESAEGEHSGPSGGPKFTFEASYDIQFDLHLFEDTGYLLSRLVMVSITQFTEYGEETKLVEFILHKAKNLELLHLVVTAPFVEMEPFCQTIYSIPSTSPNLEIDMWGKSTMKPRRFRTYEHLWDF